MYDEIDKDDQGRIHKWQFLKYMLRRYDMVSSEDLDFIMDQFHEMDDGDGKLTLADLPCKAGHKSKLHQAVKKAKSVSMVAK